jgi:hypothetical protein
METMLASRREAISSSKIIQANWADIVVVLCSLCCTRNQGCICLVFLNRFVRAACFPAAKIPFGQMSLCEGNFFRRREVQLTLPAIIQLALQTVHVLIAHKSAMPASVGRLLRALLSRGTGVRRYHKHVQQQQGHQTCLNKYCAFAQLHGYVPATCHLPCPYTPLETVVALMALPQFLQRWENSIL